MANKLKRYTLLTLLVIGFVFLEIGCSAAAPVLESTAHVTAQNISVKGSDTILPLAQAEAKEFMKENSGKIISVSGGGSTAGIKAFINGKVNIATTSREMTSQEIKAAKAKGIKPVKHVIAYDGITVIVNPANNVSKLTFNQLRGIYNGSISNWKQVGGKNKPISIIARDNSSGTYADFQKDVMQGDKYRSDVITKSTNKEIVTAVSKDSNAIGYIGFAYLNKKTKALSLSNGKDYVYPTAKSISSGKYPLSRPLNFYNNGKSSSDLTKKFIDFVLSTKGQKIVSEVGFVPVKK
ncbi:PstS family phosphate ABC transporter substrate-binding protein [Methanosarcina sp. UBA5]|uniref:PstS family phosphate ABC transporter substrate-binding protein n=1 Tax=Methanosarcina sp. UBA5 TaxID=1915593 RepID=UPI0025CE2C79|nr:PstS family phosphate ABC transporter substrate-binding protein [Methanosarcina sp. UBA5]